MNTSALVRAHDPITSVLAAEAAGAFSGPHCERILAALELGPATAHELMSLTDLSVVQIDRRLPELLRNAKAQVVQVNGEDLIRAGARVWELA